MSEDRVEKAAEGIESSVVSLTARLQSAPDGEAMVAELRLLEALLFAAVEPIGRTSGFPLTTPGSYAPCGEWFVSSASRRTSRV